MVDESGVERDIAWAMRSRLHEGMWGRDEIKHWSNKNLASGEMRV